MLVLDLSPDVMAERGVVTVSLDVLALDRLTVDVLSDKELYVYSVLLELLELLELMVELVLREMEGSGLYLLMDDIELFDEPLEMVGRVLWMLGSGELLLGLAAFAASGRFFFKVGSIAGSLM